MLLVRQKDNNRTWYYLKFRNVHEFVFWKSSYFIPIFLLDNKLFFEDSNEFYFKLENIACYCFIWLHLKYGMGKWIFKIHIHILCIVLLNIEKFKCKMGSNLTFPEKWFDFLDDVICTLK